MILDKALGTRPADNHTMDANNAKIEARMAENG